METVMESADRKVRRRRRMLICNAVGITIGVLLASPIMIALLDRREPVHLYQGKFVPEVVDSNQTVAIVWEAEELRPGCDGFLERHIEEKASGKIHIFKREPTIFRMKSDPPPVNRQTFTKEFTLPALSDGEAIYYTVGARWCNFLQKYIWPIPYRSPPIRFMVENKVKVPPDLPLIAVPSDILEDLIKKQAPMTQQRNNRRD